MIPAPPVAVSVLVAHDHRRILPCGDDGFVLKDDDEGERRRRSVSVEAGLMEMLDCLISQNVNLEAQAIFFRRRHQPSRPPALPARCR